MQSRYYRCRLQSDIVLPASANTQGNVESLEFIPGSNFLGVVAKNYAKFQKEGVAFDIFHSGSVCFGDAHIEADNKLSYKIPLSFHELKVGDGYYNRVFLSKEEQDNLRRKQKQLKQIRSGYITANLQTIKPKTRYAQKSQYDTQKRKSKESGMYGYSSLPAGSSWLFRIDYANESLIDSVEAALVGEKRIGKSKTTEYGAVVIEKLNFEPLTCKTFTPQTDESYLYLFSRALVDLSDKNLGLDIGEIVWEKSFVRQGTYTPYNYVREGFDATREFLEKGSVLVVKNLDTDKLQNNKIGSHLSEGFGDILLNPEFLEHKEPDIKEYVLPTNSQKLHKPNNTLINFLEQKEAQEEEKFTVASHVQEVYEKFIGPSKSQWGTIRSIASSTSSKEDMLQNIQEYISKGVAKKQWEELEGKLFDEINKSQNPLAFTKLLAMIVAKHTKGGKDGK